MNDNSSNIHQPSAERQAVDLFSSVLVAQGEILCRAQSYKEVINASLDHLHQVFPDTPMAMFVSNTKEGQTVFAGKQLNCEMSQWCDSQMRTPGKFKCGEESRVEHGGQTYLIFGLCHNDAIHGGLLLAEHRALSEHQNAILRLFVRYTGAVMSNLLLARELEQLRTIDAQTKVGNIKAFERAIHYGQQRLQRYPNHHFGLFIFHINGLGELSIELGPQQAKEYVSATCRFLQKRLRQSDRIFRLGEDEFAALIENGEMPNCQLLHRRLMEDAECCNITLQDNNHLPVSEVLSFSVGFASTDEYHADGIQQSAARRMYKDKVSYYRSQKQLNPKLYTVKSTGVERPDIPHPERRD